MNTGGSVVRYQIGHTEREIWYMDAVEYLMQQIEEKTWEGGSVNPEGARHFAIALTHLEKLG